MKQQQLEQFVREFADWARAVESESPIAEPILRAELSEFRRRAVRLLERDKPVSRMLAGEV